MSIRPLLFVTVASGARVRRVLEPPAAFDREGINKSIAFDQHLARGHWAEGLEPVLESVDPTPGHMSWSSKKPLRRGAAAHPNERGRQSQLTGTNIDGVGREHRRGS